MRTLHLVALLLSAALGLFVGLWAYAFPQGFYDSFPGLLGHWIDVDGPFNEHLIRDVGAMYLALAVASIGGAVWRSRAATGVLGLAWTTFGVLHLAYHVTHLDHGTAADAVGTVITLAVSLGLGIVLLVPSPPVGRATGRTTHTEEVVS